MVCHRENGLLIWKIEETEAELCSMVHLSSISSIIADKNSSHRLQSLAAQIMAFDLFGDEICHLPSGRPYLKNTDTKISISNTKNYVALTYGIAYTGVDIEMKDRNADRVIGRVSVSDELSLARSLYPDNGALLLWCLKEASYKITENQPEGLALDRQILLSGDCKSKTAIMSNPEGIFQFKFFEVDNLLVARSL